ncbi:MAG: hypothetical protein AAB554_04360 [Patescibacteria group bacterium]
MFETIVILGIIVLLISGPRAAVRFVRSRRLLLTKANEVREERERKVEEEKAAFMEDQRRYFANRGVKAVQEKVSPRASDSGILHLDRHATHRTSDENGCTVYLQYACRYGCGEVVITMHEIAPIKDGTGVTWQPIGRYCAACGAWETEHYDLGRLTGLLGRRLKGTTNLFDVLGSPKTEEASGAWERVEAEVVELETRLNGARTRRLALAEKLGKQIDGGPFRPQLIAGGKES